MDESKCDQVFDVRFLNEKTLPITQLAGFDKHHRVPNSRGTTDVRFLAGIANADLEKDLERMFASLRRAFGFKRKEISVIGPDEANGAIATPFFDYETLLSFSQQDVSQVTWQRSVANIRTPGQVFSQPFQQVFATGFSVLELATSGPLDLDHIVDHIEDSQLDSVSVDYDKDVTWCEIQFRDSMARVRVMPNQIRVISVQPVSTRELLTAFVEVQRKFLASLVCDGSPILMDAANSAP